jgi:hypothetical protein
MSTGLIEDLALYLDTNSTKVTRGSNLFVMQMPAEAANPSTSLPLVALVPIVGFPAVNRFVPNGGGPAFSRPQVGVMVRSTAGAGADPIPTAASALAHTVHDLLVQYPPNSTVSGGVHGMIHSIDAWSPPYLEDRDALNRYEFSFRLNIWDSA